MKQIAKVMAVVITGVIIGGAVYLYSRDLPWNLVDVLFPEDTIYAPRFRESRFREIELGMTQDQVLELIGPPLWIRYFADGRMIRKEEIGHQGATWIPDPPSIESSEAAYFYSKAGHRYDSYYTRVVIFGRNGSVSEIGSNFYSD